VLLLPEHLDHKFIVIARFLKSPIFVNTPSMEERFCLVLAANKESIHLDPVNWLSATARLREWSPIIEVPDITDAKGCSLRTNLVYLQRTLFPGKCGPTFQAS